MEQWGINLILGIQAAAMPTLDLPMRLLSYMGEEQLYIIVIPFLFWCVHRKVGFRMFLFLLVSTLVNIIGKWPMHLPRPYWLETKIRAAYVETGFGTPSGHAQNALGVWTYLAFLFHRFLNESRFFYVAAILGVMISCSRMYLGVHFPHDLVIGWLFAATLIAAFLILQERVADFTGAGTDPVRTIAGMAVLAGSLIAIAWAVRSTTAVAIPELWKINALAAHTAMGKPVSLNPYGIKVFVSTASLLIGAGVGLPLAARIGDFDPQGPWSKRLMRYGLGMVVFFALYIGLAVAFPKAGHDLYFVFRAVRYFILAIWVLALAPWAFIKLGLAQQRQAA